MDANDSTPPEGESASPDSFPQRCLSCQTEWTHFGRLVEDGSCPECGNEAGARPFYQWWLGEYGAETVEVSVPISSKTSAVADELVERFEYEDRSEALLELVAFRFDFQEPPTLGRREE